MKNAQEVVERVGYTEGDYIALMQHYMFSVRLYNYARKKMILWADRKDTRQLGLEKDVVANVKEGIPNLTVSFNQGKFDMLYGQEYLIF